MYFVLRMKELKIPSLDSYYAKFIDQKYANTCVSCIELFVHKYKPIIHWMNADNNINGRYNGMHNSKISTDGRIHRRIVQFMCSFTSEWMVMHCIIWWANEHVLVHAKINVKRQLRNAIRRMLMLFCIQSGKLNTWWGICVHSPFACWL